MANITRRLGRLVRLLAVLGLSFLLLTCDNVLQIGLGDKADIEPPSVTLDSPRDGEYLSGTVRFRGSIADDVEVSKVEVSTNGGQSFAETSFDWEAGTWDHELATTDFPDGEYEFHVRATDQAGRTTTTKALVYVDNAAPAVMVRTPQGIQGSEFNKTISISGDAYDQFGIQHVTLTLTLLDGAGDPVEQLHLRPDLSSWQEAYENNDDRADVADGTNSWTYDFDSTVYSDNADLGTGFVEAFAFTVTATDKAGNENDVIFHGDDVRALLGRTPTVNEVYHALATTGVLADSDGAPQPLEESAGEGFSLAINQYLDLPIVEYTTPSPESTEADPDTLGMNPVLSGSVTDDDGIDLGTIEIRVIESEDDTTTPWTTLSGEQISGSGSRVNWTYDLEEAVGPANVQGPHWVELRVDDINGESSPDTGPIFFLVDYGPPQLTETESGITGTSWVYRNEDVPLGGVATDGNVVDSVVATYSKDGGTPVEFLNDTTDDGEWSTNLPISLGDGAYEVTITASDGATTTTINRNIVIDTVSPSLSITAPGSDEAVDTDTYTIRGQATDGNGRGVAALDYSLDFTDDGDDTNDTWHAIDVAGLNWSRAGVDVSAGGQGAKTLTVRAADGLNPYTYESVSFSYDTAAPTLSETSVGTTAQVIRNADFTLSGNVDDTNELASIIITAERDGADMGEVYSASTEGAYTFTRNVAANGDDDGAWQYGITATDTAGRVTQLTRLVLIDATAPDTPTVDPFVGTYAVNELVSSGSTADSGSGVETVEYSFDYTDDGDDTNDTWAPAGGTNSWFRTIDIGTTGADLPEGTHTLFVRATDRAGNRSGVGNRSFIVDRENPIIAVDGFEGTQYRNTSFTIDGTVSDSLELAVDPVSVAVEGPSGAVDLSASPLSYSAGAWSQDVPIDQGDGEYTVAVGAIDSV
ncbi:MAG: Ig-like domain-containing protein, partial [Spirochaetota bacterium]